MSRPRPMSFCAAFLRGTDGGFQSLPHPKPVENRDSRNQSLRTSGGLRGTLCRRPPAAIRKGCRSAPQAPQAQAASDCAASGAPSRTGRRARRNAVVNYNRRAASDLRAFAIAQVTLARRPCARGSSRAAHRAPQRPPLRQQLHRAAARGSPAPPPCIGHLRFQPDGLPIASIADGSQRPGHIVLAVGNYDGWSARN